MSNKIKVFLTGITVCLFSILLPELKAEEIIYSGEVLEYDVTFMSFKLGKIKIETLANSEYNGIKTYHSKVYMESNPNIPFLAMKAIFNSWMDKTLTSGVYFEGSTKLGSDAWGVQKIIFNAPKSHFLKNKKYYDNKILSDTILKSNRKIVDGATLFFLARRYVDNKKKLKVPTIMDLSIGNTYLNFSGKTENIEIDAVDYPIKTYYFDGKAEWKGIYGLGDKFEGWFSCDDARIPIKAKMHVYIGSVVLELKKWKRGHWKPPCS